MITELEIENFKCFRHLRLSFGALTLLTGLNGGGKSSAIQPLLLLAQGTRMPADSHAFALNGPLVHLGTVGDILPSDRASKTLSFAIVENETPKRWEFTARAGDRFLKLSRRAPSKRSTNATAAPGLISLARITYISAIREGTADAFPLPDTDETSRDVGIDGSYAPYLYNILADEEVPAAKLKADEKATSFRKQLDAWLGTLFPEAQCNVQLVPQLSLLNLQFRLSEIGAWRRPVNIGYGLTYAFPILVALLAAEQGQLVIIDSPEAHLHPYAQSQMGRLLAHFASAGVQILVETHSDHLLNGVRLAVKERMLPNSSLRLHFFTRASHDSHGVISPEIGTDGRISEWPDGFFDQAEKDLSLLANW
jgi:predicted ATPase